jgi:hypothetical protein
LDDALAPVPNTAVVFRVVQDSGVVAAGSSDEARAAVVATDAQGLAWTRFKVGTRSGSSNQKVRVTVAGYDDEALFNASALANAGDKISVNSGNNQRGAVGQVLPDPFVVVVTDNGGNVVGGARVGFTVTRGGGTLTSGLDRYETATDSDGRASAEYALAPPPGIDAQAVSASLLDAPAGQVLEAVFNATGFVPGNPGQTSISGVVVDNQNSPLPGVTVRAEVTTRSAVADAQGQFRITEAPVGPVHLTADGSTSTVAGEYPSLSYNIVTVAGVDNPLAAPIYMVRLDTANAVYAGPTDVVLELPGYPGFKLEIAKGAVTFPDGSKAGQVSVTAVNASAVPMSPPNGMQPQFIITIQPTGTRIDPPARLTIPNVDGFPPGTQTEMYSFDHDLEEFVSIGLGSVSEDGTVIRSNPGVGVIKAGWHAATKPAPQACVCACHVCQRCVGTSCQCVASDEGSVVNDSRDKPHDCKKYVCQNGAVVPANDDSDEPENKLGDCRHDTCKNGAPWPVAADDPPFAENCKHCSNGVLQPIPDGPVIKKPAPARGPAPVLVGATEDWGLSDHANYENKVQCTPTCIAGEQEFGFDGDVVPSKDWTVTVATIVSYGSGCLDAARTPTNIARTTTHEEKHVTSLMSVINEAETRVGSLYVSQAACDTALNLFSTELEAIGP